MRVNGDQRFYATNKRQFSYQLNYHSRVNLSIWGLVAGSNTSSTSVWHFIINRSYMGHLNSSCNFASLKKLMLALEKLRIRCQKSLCGSKHWQFAWREMCHLKSRDNNKGIRDALPAPAFLFPVILKVLGSEPQPPLTLLCLITWQPLPDAGGIQRVPCQRICASWRYRSYFDCVSSSVRPRVMLRVILFPSIA